jgi:nucleoside-diphosphate-sugar epimerase
VKVGIGRAGGGSEILIIVTDAEFAGRVALLTGASGGIGGALGRRLIEAGARVAFTYGRHPEEAEQLVAEARQAGSDAVALAGDLTDPGMVERGWGRVLFMSSVAAFTGGIHPR